MPNFQRGTSKAYLCKDWPSIPIIMNWHQYHRTLKRGSLQTLILSTASRVQVYSHAVVPRDFQTRSSQYTVSTVQMGLQNRGYLLPMKQIAHKNRVVLLYCCLRLLSPSLHIQKFNFHSEKLLNFCYNLPPTVTVKYQMYSHALIFTNSNNGGPIKSLLKDQVIICVCSLFTVLDFQC